MNEARNNRFFKLINFCKKNDLFHLFVAHHQDDNLETYFLRKIAGSNFEGLRSMRMNSEIQGLRILRPLLNFSKDQVLRYNKKNNIFYVNDPSNKNLSYSRIIIRKFLSDRKKLKKEVNTDFKLIQNYFPYYKKMIFQKFNLMLISINKKSITMDKKIFFIEELEIQCKIIEVIYKYLLPNKVPLRYSKIMNSIRILITPETKKINLAGMLIKKDQFSIYFRI